jgi:hypothetical protein
MASLKNRTGQNIKNLHNWIQYNLCQVFYNYQSWSNIIGVVTRLWNGQMRNHGIIPSRGKRFSFPNVSKLNQSHIQFISEALPLGTTHFHLMPIMKP